MAAETPHEPQTNRERPSDALGVLVVFDGVTVRLTGAYALRRWGSLAQRQAVERAERRDRWLRERYTPRPPRRPLAAAWPTPDPEDQTR